MRVYTPEDKCRCAHSDRKLCTKPREEGRGNWSNSRYWSVLNM